MSEGKRKKPLTVAEALAGYLKQSGLGDRIEQATAVDDWAERVGKKIADVTAPVHVRDGVLFVAVQSSAWLMELRMMEAEIRSRLNEGRERGRIQKIRFVMDGEERPRGPGWGRGQRGGGNLESR
jgi:predicted nucleic acid-binding Zn ribbon protein